MNRDQAIGLSSDLAAVEERLRSERAVASGLELDELKLRAMSQAGAARPGTRLKGRLMKSRFALLAMIVAGLMMSMTGATLAISGSSGAGSAAKGEYGGGDTPSGQQQGGGNGDTLGAEQGPGGQAGTGAEGADNGSGNGSAPGDTQAAEQAAATGSGGNGGNSLPFTGLLAIPLLIGGVALLGTGGVLRHKARQQP